MARDRDAGALTGTTYGSSSWGRSPDWRCSSFSATRAGDGSPSWPRRPCPLGLPSPSARGRRQRLPQAPLPAIRARPRAVGRRRPRSCAGSGCPWPLSNSRSRPSSSPSRPRWSTPSPAPPGLRPALLGHGHGASVRDGAAATVLIDVDTTRVGSDHCSPLHLHPCRRRAAVRQRRCPPQQGRQPAGSGALHLRPDLDPATRRRPTSWCPAQVPGHSPCRSHRRDHRLRRDNHLRGALMGAPPPARARGAQPHLDAPAPARLAQGPCLHSADRFVGRRPRMSQGGGDAP